MIVKSSKPSKQRVFRREAPMHVRRKLMSSHLSPALRKELKRRSLPVRKGDEVIVLRGSHKGVKSKVESVNRKRYRVLLEGVDYERKNGSKVSVPFDSSNLLITSLDKSDSKRFGGGGK